MNWANAEGDTFAYCESVPNGNIVRALIDAGAYLDPADLMARCVYCLLERNFEIRKMLIEAKANFMQSDKKGSSPLDAAKLADVIILHDTLFSIRGIVVIH